MNIIKLFIIFCLHRARAKRSTMPVIYIDSEHVLDSVSVPTNPFHKMTSTSFSDIAHTAMVRSERVVIFAEDHFSVEDITSKDSLGTPYYHLHEAVLDQKARYIPSVTEPFKTLKQMFPPLEPNVIHLSNFNMKPLQGNFQYYYVFFQDQGYNETRVQKLRRHDRMMRTVYGLAREMSPGPVVAFYTGKNNPVTMMPNVTFFQPEMPPLQPETETEPTNMMIVTEGALFQLAGVFSTSGTRRSLQSAPAVAEQSMINRRLSTRMLYSDFELEFNFQYRRYGWLLDSVSLLEDGEEVGRTKMEVGAPWDWSYYCSEPMVVFNQRDKSAVVIGQYQVEPLLTNEYGAEFLRTVHGNETGDPVPRAKTRFSNTLNCGPYFNSAILSCLMVVALLLMITTYGLTSLFNCQANSKYDDPNGKPLVIVAQL